ncbi:hypothetical protein [Henriciella marina]|uniref:hypothetical protein n=1 Tax=Henriciella marina TaxID=453851 RepID=UPI00037EA1BF|nr:hypothetical protein [Henriciella marina]
MNTLPIRCARPLLAAATAALMACGVAQAQNTSSVSGPVVSAGDREVEYRFGWVPGEDGRGDSFGHRFDYRLSVNERTSLKVATNFEDNPGEDIRFDNINVEYLIELSPEDADIWKTGIRFDARVSNGPDPERIGFNWLNQWQLSDRLRARAQLIATRQLGYNGRKSIDFEVRSSLSWKIGADHDIALLSFTNLGSSDDFSVGGRVQQAGPALSGKLGNGYGWTAGTLFGLSDAAPENDIRLWITKSF